MMNAHEHTTSSAPLAAPRLVLISAEPEPQEAQQSLRILGSEPRMSGNFRLTDR